jgi:hypothetical protein
MPRSGMWLSFQQNRSREQERTTYRHLLMNRLLYEALCLLQQLHAENMLTGDEEMLVDVLSLVQDVANQLATLETFATSLPMCLTSLGDDNLIGQLALLSTGWQRVVADWGDLLASTGLDLERVALLCYAVFPLAEMISCRLLKGQALFQQADIRQQLARLR